MKADIFFFITAISVIVITSVVVVALFYVIRILRSVEHISHHVEEEGVRIREDINELRKNIKTEGVKFKHLANFVGIFSQKGKPRARGVHSEGYRKEK